MLLTNCLFQNLCGKPQSGEEIREPPLSPIQHASKSSNVLRGWFEATTYLQWKFPLTDTHQGWNEEVI